MPLPNKFAVLTLLLMSSACAHLRAQGAASAPSPAASLQSSAPFRSIEDPASGVRWLLYRDPAHPAGPGAFVRRTEAYSAAAPTAPVIRAGNRVLVEEHTPVVDALLEGVALESAAEGAILRIRLSIGGRMVAARAERSGHAVLLPPPEDLR